MKKKLLFVYNPKAGKEKIRENLADVLDVFAAHDYDLTVVPTRRKDEAREVVRDRSKDYDLVVCSGGDGTLDETVTGMIQSGFRTTVGYIPAHLIQTQPVVLVVEVTVFIKRFVQQVVNQCVAVSVAVKSQPSFLLDIVHRSRLTRIHDLLADLKIGCSAQTLETILVMSDDQIAVVRQHRREIGRELVLLPFDTVELLIGEVERVVLEVQNRRRVSCAVYRATTLQRHLAVVRIAVYRFDDNQHAALDLLLFGIRHIGPAVLIHVFLNRCLERLIHLFVRTLNLVRVNRHGAVDLLCLHRNKEQGAKTKDNYVFNSQRNIHCSLFIIHYNHFVIDMMFPVFSLNTMTGRVAPVNKSLASGTSTPNCATEIVRCAIS